MKIVYKKCGETPLQCINRESKAEKKSYAGRLDPMAEGLLLILENEECKKTEEHRELNKTYEYSYVLGIETDSYDVLGVITKINKVDVTEEEINTITNSLVGKITLQYPAYSSKPVNGIPLFKHSQEGTINNIKIPSITTNIFTHKVESIQKIDLDNLRKDIIPIIKNVNGDFRIKEIVDSWNLIKNRELILITAIASVSSGTYIRSMVNHIGEGLKCGAVAIKIKRTKIGEYENTTANSF